MSEPVDPSKLSYREAVDELEAIVSELDRGEIDLDELTAKFQRAVTIVEQLDERVQQTKQQVDDLLPRLEKLKSRD